MKGILLPVLLSALALVATSRAEINEKKIKDLQRFGELLSKAGPFSSTKIRQNPGIKCKWENVKFGNPQGLSCEEVQEYVETRDDLKKIFREICPIGDLDLCLKEKPLSGDIVRLCFCSSEIQGQLRNKCFDVVDKNYEPAGRGCACNDKNYCNNGDNFDHYDSSDGQNENGNKDGDKDGHGHKDGSGTDGSSRGGSGGGDLPSALGVTTLVILGLFGPRLF